VPSLLEVTHALALGKTKVFMKTDTLKELEGARRKALKSAVVVIQKFNRGMAARRKSLDMMHIYVQMLQTLCEFSKRPRHSLCDLSAEEMLGGNSAGVSKLKKEAWQGESITSIVKDEKADELCETLEELLEQADEKELVNGVVREVRRMWRRLSQEIEARNEIENSADSINPVDLERVIARVSGLNLPRTPALMALENRIPMLKQQLPLIRAMENGLASSKNFKAIGESGKTQDEAGIRVLREIVEEVKSAGLDSSDKWLPELEGMRAYHTALTRISEWDQQVREREAARIRAEEETRRAEEEEMVKKIAETKDSNERDVLRAKHAKLRSENADMARMLQETRDAEEEAAAAAFKELKKGRRTVAFIAQSAEEELLIGLKKATDEYDSEKLEKLLCRAAECGLEDDDGEMSKAREMYTLLQSEDFLFQKIKCIRREAEQQNASTLVLRQLESVLCRLRKMPGYEVEVAEATKILQKGLALRAALIGQKSIFNSKDPDELKLASRTFDKLCMFSRLKPEKNWGGHRQGASARSRKSTVGRPTRRSLRMTRKTIMGTEEGGMLTFSKGCIVESLTQVPQARNATEYEDAGEQNFRNLLVFMGERPAQQAQRKASEDSVLSLLRTDPGMQDEVYVQLMKQLVKNPGTRSMQLGWQLLHRLCQQSPPSGELFEFVYAFIRRQMNGKGNDTNGDCDSDDDSDDDAEEVPPWLVSTAQACLAVLESPDHQASGDESEVARLKDEVVRLTDENNRLTAELGEMSKKRAVDRPTILRGADAESAQAIVAKLLALTEEKRGYIKQLASDHAAQAVKIGKLTHENARITGENKRLVAELTRLSIRSIPPPVDASED